MIIEFIHHIRSFVFSFCQFVMLCEVSGSFYFHRLFLAIITPNLCRDSDLNHGDTYNQSFSRYSTVTLCPLLTASSSSTHG